MWSQKMLNPWIWQWILRNDTKSMNNVRKKKKIKKTRKASCNEKDSEVEPEVWVLLLIQDPVQVFSVPSFHFPVPKRRGRISEVPSRVVTDWPCLSVLETSPKPDSDPFKHKDSQLTTRLEPALRYC